MRDGDQDTKDKSGEKGGITANIIFTVIIHQRGPVKDAMMFLGVQVQVFFFFSTSFQRGKC